MNKSTDLLLLAHEIVPTDLIPEVERSFDVPQFGPYHQEGPFMDSHLDLVLEVLEDIDKGYTDPRVPGTVHDLMVRAVDEVGIGTCQLYILLHDLDKANCLTIVFRDGRKVAFSWDEWKGMFTGSTGEDLALFCAKEGIKQISYYQEIDGETRTHGHVTAERLSTRDDIPKIVVTAIKEHELAFTFGARGGVNIPLVEKMVEDKSAIELGFMFAVNYADQMGSWRDYHVVDISDFLLMAESYVAFQQLGELTKRLQYKRLDQHKVAKLVATLRNSTNAFREEDVDQAYARIVGACKLPEVSEADVRTALQPAIAEGLQSDIVEALVADMTKDGKLSPNTGKSLGKHNQMVRKLLATLG